MSLSTVTIAVHQDEGTQCQSGQVRQVSRALTGLVLRRPINISASFFLLTWTSYGCHGVGGRPATGRAPRRCAAAAPSFINVHHLNVIRHPVALVRVDTIRLELKLLVKGPSKKDVEAMYFERMMFFSLDHLVTINQILNFVVVYIQKGDRPGQALLSSN